MEFSNFSTGKNDVSRRLDKVIRLFAENLSLPEIYKGIRKGLIKVNNKKTKSDYRIQENDTISIASFLLNNLKADEYKAEAGGPSSSIENEILKIPEIVFENEHILIINKPYNINVHGDKNSLDKIVEQYYENKGINSSLSFKPGPLHRLDRNTTGLIAFSMSLEGARWFTENIKTHNIRKIYYGLSEGHLGKEENWKDIISKDDEKGSGFHKVSAKRVQDINQLSLNDKNEKLAETTATPLAWGKINNREVTLIKFAIKTGRKHQIRAQSALHGHVLYGDRAYGGEKNKFSNEEFYLTAKELLFPKDNPLGLPEKLSINLPSAFTDILKYCGIEKTGV